MIEMTLGEVAAATGGRVDPADADTVIDVVVTDSRKAGARGLFVPLRGEQADGHDFIHGALEAGAAAYLTERGAAEGTRGAIEVDDTWQAIARLGAAVRDRVDPSVVAVTGSVGKTTTKDLTAAALRAARRTVAAEGSFNNELGVPLTLLSLAPDTQAVVVEIGARGVGHIAALTPHVRPDVSIVTAVAAAHTELFGDLETVAVAKGELVEALTSDGAAVLNGDDPRVRAMRDRTDATVLTYGWAGDAEVDVRGEGILLDDHARASFRALTPWGSADVTLPISGEHHVGNALAALTAAGHLGVPLDDAAHALAAAPISRWRSALTEVGGVAVLNDAYNANPTSLRAALRTLTSLSQRRGGRAIAVLGQMAELGAGSREAHHAIGADARDLGIDHLIVVEGGDAGAIAEGATVPVDAVPDADAALSVLLDLVRPGDAVLAKGSRVAGLERVADGLIADLSQEPPA